MRQLVGKGVDAYGVDPRPGLVDRAELDGTDLREEGALEHLRAVEPAALGGIVLSGVVDGMTPGERTQLLEVVCDRLAPDGILVVHSLSPSGWWSEAAPAEADLSPGRPLRAATWPHLLAPLGFEATVTEGPSGTDYLVTAVLARGAAPTVSPTPEAAVDRPPPGGAVHQFVPALIARDATGSHTLLLRQALRDAGWRSEIFAEATHDELLGETLPIDAYRGLAAPGDVLVYQFSTSSAVADFLAERPEPLVLDYHNVTRPALYGGWDPVSAARSAAALEQLGRLAPRAALGLADSAYNVADLLEAGCRRTAVVPVLVDLDRLVAAPDPRVAARLAAGKAEGGSDWLFVGRLVPSKAQHDLVKAVWAYRRLYDPLARLHLVGPTPSGRYLASLRGFVADLGLAGAVRISGRGVRRRPGRPLRGGRRLRLALGPRGVRRPPARGDAGLGAGGGPRRGGRRRAPSAGPASCWSGPSRPTWPPRSSACSATTSCGRRWWRRATTGSTRSPWPRRGRWPWRPSPPWPDRRPRWRHRTAG